MIECQCSAHTLTSNFYVYGAGLYNKVIQKPALQTCTKVSISQLNLT